MTAEPRGAVYWCEQAWLGGDGAVDGVLLTVSDDVITAVETGVGSAPSGSTRLPGLTLPGFANGHSHAFHRALRGRTHGGAGTFWTWRDRMYELAAALDPDTFEDLAVATFAEMVLAGFTCVGEFHYLHHPPDAATYADRNEMGERVKAAASRAGIRLTLLDACYLAGGIGVAVNTVQQRFSDGSVERWIERVSAMAGSDTCLVGAAIHSVRAVDPPSMATVAGWSHRNERVLHAHVSEQVQENHDTVAAFGLTPLRLLDDVGAIGGRFTAVHATHVDGPDIATLAAASACCCICPTTERDLADGIGPTTALRDAGVALSIGSDSHAVIDPLEEIRALELDARLASLRRGNHEPDELLAIGSAAGYRSLGWADGGVLRVGALADFVTVARDSPRIAGSGDRHALGAVVFAATAVDVSDVVIGGRHLVRRGEHRDLDVGASLDSAITAAWRAVERP